MNMPIQLHRHYGLDKKIIEKRIKTYEKAKSEHPKRWSKDIRNWTLLEYVSLNPISEEEIKNILNK